MKEIKSEKKWRFLSNQNSIIVGINDAGIETFTANMNESLVREIIQNSLDAIRNEVTDPVEVEFVKFCISPNEIPDLNGLKDAIKKCKESNENEPDACEFFKKAEDILSQKEIKVLRISDYKTKGLEGADTCEKGTNWSRLVKENGSSNKGYGSGGSFGIGKSAAFACSDLRTVFYSSKDICGLKSNFGVAKLVSYKDKKDAKDEYWTTGVGYYSENEKFVAIKELANIDTEHTRNDSGTDIYILGMHDIKDFESFFTKAVLLNFLVSLVNKKLVVRIRDKTIDSSTLYKTIDSSTLDEYMKKLNLHESEEIKNLVEYYDTLTSSNPNIKVVKLDSTKYGKEFGFKDGECTLYLKEGEGLNRKIMITRRAGMKILEQNYISGSIDFTGVLVIEGDNMNEVFRKMEVPSHDSWEPNRIRNQENDYKKILSNFRKYLRETVRDSFGTEVPDSMDALGASEFLPNVLKKEEEKELHEDEMSTRIKSLGVRKVDPYEYKTKNFYLTEDDRDSDSNENGTKSKHTSSSSHDSNSSISESNPDSGKVLENKKSIEKKLQEVLLNKRLICVNAKSGIYNLNFVVPKKALEAKLEFKLLGEQSNFKLPIKSAKVLIGNGSVTSIQDNKVFLSNLDKGESLKLEVEVEFDEYCMMEVAYYARKK